MKKALLSLAIIAALSSCNADVESVSPYSLGSVRQPVGKPLPESPVTHPSIDTGRIEHHTNMYRCNKCGDMDCIFEEIDERISKTHAETDMELMQAICDVVNRRGIHDQATLDQLTREYYL